MTVRESGLFYLVIEMLMKFCPKCGKPIAYGQSRCVDCQRFVNELIAERKAKQRLEANRRYNRTRDVKYGKFYNSEDWHRLSQFAMSRAGYRCEECGAVAGQMVDGMPVKLDVHHVKPIRTEEGWARRFDVNNLKVLCTRCHNDVHGRFTKEKD